jgi:hypothetical protein
MGGSLGVQAVAPTAIPPLHLLFVGHTLSPRNPLMIKMISLKKYSIFCNFDHLITSIIGLDIFLTEMP